MKVYKGSFGKVVSTMGYNVFSDHLEKVPLDKKHVVLNTISPNSYGIAKNDGKFKNALKDSDILVLDGVYFGLGYFLSTGKAIKKNQGPEVFDFFINKANDLALKVYFLGSSQETLEKIKVKVKLKYPKVKVSSFSPPFRQKFSEEETNEMINKINKFKPDILFVGMTCPKQEKWIFLNKEKIDANLICNIGAVFDWVAGNQKTIHPIWWKLRLAWLKRTIDRPEILKRYPNIFLYFKDMLLFIFKLKKSF
ncbi:WecB/TagA/CpsF family glycosyltransferase [Echinicola jeungdonensis]|uniref:WecB/TagA/CpsF family glycosyltransferase n=1 Tax=Echinicola jeungdonensis TaxID=709343 RepID=A0ABV5J582_9BACT|nr:WecB/TagA/CpsF family glycosyltransferase [Echinicola jeungdonensis]MDN3668114.1 WecB/TagA/CpsF family glycosyltransferase [Echinicola jeungdonensis]